MTRHNYNTISNCYNWKPFRYDFDQMYLASNVFFKCQFVSFNSNTGVTNRTGSANPSCVSEFTHGV